MARSIRFYRLLGLEVPEKPDEGHIDTFLPNGVRWRRRCGASDRNGHAKLGTSSASRSNARTLSWLMRSTHELPRLVFPERRIPGNAVWGQRYAQLRDPDGVPIDLYAQLRSREMSDTN